MPSNIPRGSIPDIRPAVSGAVAGIGSKVRETVAGGFLGFVAGILAWFGLGEAVLVVGLFAGLVLYVAHVTAELTEGRAPRVHAWAERVVTFLLSAGVTSCVPAAGAVVGGSS